MDFCYGCPVALNLHKPHVGRGHCGLGFGFDPEGSVQLAAGRSLSIRLSVPMISTNT